MELLFGLVVLALTGAVVILIYLLLKKKPANQNDSGLVLIQNQLNELTRTIDTRIGESSKLMHDSVRTQFTESQKLIKEITQELSLVKETGKRVEGFADQLQNLQDILKNPKQRGILGEYYLETVLKNILPPASYQMQYKFKNGEIVDAVIFIKEKIIPIDSKFSLENYNKILEERDVSKKEELEKIFKQDLKNRIDETAKYIRPNENTMDFAFMFIPSEGVFYDLLINQVGAIKVNTADLIEYAFKQRHVIIVSPTSFFAYLQTVLQGLRALQVEEKTQEIIKQVNKLGKHLSNYQTYWDSLGKNLTTTVSAYNKGSHEFRQIDKDIIKIAGQGTETEIPEIDKPKEE
ncbi:MAG: DNA recombination protein RmuC [Patescibacteria group bacterium]